MAEHIRIGDVAPRVHYVADGAQTAFVFPFPIFEEADLEVRVDGLVTQEGFLIHGAGASEGGLVAFQQPPAAGRQVLLRRVLVMQRVSDFQPNGVLRANTLNDELDRQTAGLQELREDLQAALRAAPGDAPATLTLPSREGRANRLLAFDSLGNATAVARDPVLLAPFTKAVARTVEDKLGERLSARDFGAAGDGVTDDGPALQAAMNAAAASGKVLEIGEGSHRTTSPLTLPGAAAGLVMRGSILYAGPGGSAALTIGDGAATRNQGKSYQGLRVLRASLSDWLDERDIGVVLRNLDACSVSIARVEGFTIGIRTLGVELGFEDSTIHLGRIVNNRIGLDIRTATAEAWNNSVRYIGGHFANSAATHPSMDRFGVRFSCEAGAYNRHNAHLFLGPGFELQRGGGDTGYPQRGAIPFLLEAGDERGIQALGVRMEQCSRYVARHVGGANDCCYEVNYVGNYAFEGCAVHYPATATRAGGTVIARHQAAAAQGSPRLIAEAGHVRGRAFRWSAEEIGFEGMACLSGNPAGPPSTLDGFAFPGLPDIILNGDSVGLPTSRALGFVVDAATCKEFFVAAEGERLRIVVQQFDAGGDVILQDRPVLFSNMNVVGRFPASAEPSNAHWWEGNANIDSLVTSGGLSLPLNRLQRVTLHADAAWAVIGVRGAAEGTEAPGVLKALRLYCSALHAPGILYGGSRRWGVRELQARLDFDPPEIPAGGNTTQAVPLPFVQGGDLVQASHTAASGFIEWSAAITTTGQGGSVTCRATNRHGSLAINLAAGTLFVRATKPRI